MPTNPFAAIHAASVRRAEAEFAGVADFLPAILAPCSNNNVPLSLVLLAAKRHGYTGTEGKLKPLVASLGYRVERTAPPGGTRRYYLMGVDFRRG